MDEQWGIYAITHSFPENVCEYKKKNYAVVKNLKAKYLAECLCILFFILAMTCFLLVFCIFDNAKLLMLKKKQKLWPCSSIKLPTQNKFVLLDNKSFFNVFIIASSAFRRRVFEGNLEKRLS